MVHLIFSWMAIALIPSAGEASMSVTTEAQSANLTISSTSSRDAPLSTSFRSSSAASSTPTLSTSEDISSTTEIPTIVFSPVFETSAASLDTPGGQPTPNAASATSTTLVGGQQSQFGPDNPGSATPISNVSPVTTSSGVSPTAFVVASQTLAMSHPVVVGQGSSAVTISLATAGSSETNIVIGTSTIAISQLAAGISTMSPQASPSGHHGAAAITFGSLVASANNGEVDVGSTALKAGQTVTEGAGASKTVISVQTASGGSGFQIVVADASSTTTENLPTASSGPSQIGSQGLTPKPTSDADKLQIGSCIIVTLAVGWLWFSGVVL